MREKTRKLTTTALLVALTFLLGLTPIGYIPNPFTFGVLSLTLMCLPVIIGTISLGLKAGLILGFVFGITSLFNALGITLAVPDLLGAYLLQISVLRTLIIIFIPRMIIPVITWLVYKAVKGESARRRQAATGIAAFAGSITNTVLFLSALYLAFISEISEVSLAFAGLESIFGFTVTPDTLFKLYAVIAGINGIPEAIVAVLLSIPIIYALSKIRRKANNT